MVWCFKWLIRSTWTCNKSLSCWNYMYPCQQSHFEKRKKIGFVITKLWYLQCNSSIESSWKSVKTKWKATTIFVTSFFFIFAVSWRTINSTYECLIKWQRHTTCTRASFTHFTFLRHFTCTEIFNELFICPVSSASTWKINKIRNGLACASNFVFILYFLSQSTKKKLSDADVPFLRACTI